MAKRHTGEWGIEIPKPYETACKCQNDMTQQYMSRVFEVRSHASSRENTLHCSSYLIFLGCVMNSYEWFRIGRAFVKQILYDVYHKKGDM